MNVGDRWLNVLGRARAFVGRKHNAILMYHSIGGSGHAPIPVERFRRGLRRLVTTYDVVDLPDVIPSTPERDRKVALTFDDGYADFYEYVRPLLHEFGVPATVFVPTNCLDDRGFTIDSGDASYLTGDQIARLVDDDLITVGNHTMSHPRLSTLDRSTIENEVVGGKEQLEANLETTVERFCYPYGDYDERVVDVVRRSHRYAVTVDIGTLGDSPDPHRLPRLNATVSAPLLRADVGSHRRWLRRRIIG